MAIGTTSLGAFDASSGSRGSKQFIVLGSLRLPVGTESATCARRFARMVLDLSGGAADVRDDVEVIVSELVTNVVLHVERDGEPFALVVFAQLGAMLRLEVHDSGESVSLTAEPDSTSEHGRGLWIVGMLAQSWGVDETPDGKCVWAEIEAWATPTARAEA